MFSIIELNLTIYLKKAFKKIDETYLNPKVEDANI